MSDYGGPSWSYSPDWDDYLSESGAWDDPDILCININKEASADDPVDDWWQLQIDFFEGNVSFEWGHIVLKCAFLDFSSVRIPVTIKVPMCTNRDWNSKKPKPLFAPYWEASYWDMEIERDWYNYLMDDVFDTINKEHSKGGCKVLMIRERHADKDSCFDGQPEWAKKQGLDDVMCLRLEGNFRDLLAEWIDSALDYAFRGSPEMDI
jgi:hypothetical protein